MISVILSGGAGSRLWPISRESHPKPFIKLNDGETLIQKTYQRAKALGSEILTVTNRDYLFLSQDELEKVGGSGSYLLEPIGRNTAPAIALAAKYTESQHGTETIMLILAADHLIADQHGFEAAVLEAVSLAKDDYLVTFGVVPTAPEIGYGYIQMGRPINTGYKVKCFVEKPDIETAKKYLDSGDYLWNSGMFCFKAGVFLSELALHAPVLSVEVDRCWQAMNPIDKHVVAKIPAGLFKEVPDISIDYAVMEKSDRVAVVPGDFGWSDIGSWNAIKNLVEADDNGNRVLGGSILIETSDTFIHSEQRLVATVGVADLMIIDTPDALLVAHADKSQEVKQVVDQLKKAKNKSFSLHRTANRPWGTYTILEEGAGYKIKRIVVKPGASLSLQKHHHRSEHWVVVEGTALIINGEKEVLVQVNESAFIRAGERHRLSNPGLIPCIMIEVQCGPYLGEDDIVRFNDIYDRAD